MAIYHKFYLAHSWILYSIYKVSNNFSPPHKNKILEIKNEQLYNLRQNSQFSRPFRKSVCHGTETIF